MPWFTVEVPCEDWYLKVEPLGYSSGISIGSQRVTSPYVTRILQEKSVTLGKCMWLCLASMYRVERKVLICILTRSSPNLTKMRVPMVSVKLGRRSWD